jgi:hypothetical protein
MGLFIGGMDAAVRHLPRRPGEMHPAHVMHARRRSYALLRSYAPATIGCCDHTAIMRTGDHTRQRRGGSIQWQGLRRPSGSIPVGGIQCGGAPVRVDAFRTGHAAAGADHHGLTGGAGYVGVSRGGRPFLKAGSRTRGRRQSGSHQQGARSVQHCRSPRTGLGQSLALDGNACATVWLSGGRWSFPRNRYVCGGR